MTHLLPGFFLPFFGFGFVMYFLPSIIALARSKRDITAIVLLNFFLGWDDDRVGGCPGVGSED